MGKSEGGSTRARRAIGNLDRQFSRLSAGRKEADAQIDAEFLDTKSAIVTDRNKRLLEATDEIPWVMWLGTIGGGIIVMTMSFLVYMEQAWPHAVMASLTASLIGLLLFIMLVLSRPFSGPLAIGPQHFEAALKVMDDVDRGN